MTDEEGTTARTFSLKLPKADVSSAFPNLIIVVT